MTSYTLHLPAGTLPGDIQALERGDLVKDGFVWGAFVFTALWFFLNRLWLAGLGVLAAMVALAVGLNMFHVNQAAAFVAMLLLMILVGLEASSLKRWTLARRGRPVADVVIAASLDQAETKAFGRWLDKTAPRALTSPPSGATYRPLEGVLGLFPEAEGRR